MTTAPSRVGAAPNQPLNPQSLASIWALQTGSGPDLMSLLIDIFLEDSAKVVSDLRNAVKIGELHKVQQLSHRLKGSCASFGASALMTICEDLEGLGRNGSAHDAAESLAYLETEYGRVRTALEQIRSVSTLRMLKSAH
jgi:two-component system sensor histidine kinase/response regulator